MIELAQGNNVGGLELRAAPDEFLHVGIPSAERRAIKSRLDDAGLIVLALSTYVHLCSPEDQLLEEHLQLAADVGAHAVRVFMRDEAGTTDSAAGGAPTKPTQGERRAVKRVAWLSGSTGVRVLMETHDSHSLGARMAAFCTLLDQEVADHGAGVIWDRCVMRALQDDGYEGWLSLEWERKWHPELPPLDEALPATWTWITREERS